jgi:hypothetical protein
MDKDMLEMARWNYGYGRWDAPYWFIGLEQGMAFYENRDLCRRVRAWVDLGRRELNDCREFHCRIGERRWHFKQPVNLQPSWRPLMLLMMTFQGCTVEYKDTLRDYQREKWGSLYEETGETCVIELSGLAAPNLKETQDSGQYLQERIGLIRSRIHRHRPELVVMYGKAQKHSWEKIAGATFPPEPKNFVRCGPTVLAFARHPVASAREGNKYWEDLGRNLREFAQSSAAIP